MSEKKYEFRNEFVIACIISIVIVLVMCYFTFSSSFLSTSVIKGTSAAESCTCAADEEKITGNLCRKIVDSDLGSPWTCEAMTGGSYSCTKSASCATVPEDDEYACFYHGEEQVWRKYGDYKDNSEYQYISNVKREDCADTGNVCGVDKKYGTWTETTCKNAGHTWDSSNSCCVCGAGYYVNSSSVCTKCESGYYCTGDRKRVKCGTNKSSPEGSTKESDCVSDTVTVTYKSGGGSGTMSSTKCVKNEECTISSNAFKKTNYTFSGWSGSDSKEYKDGETITISSNLTLTAKWEKNPSSSTPSSSTPSSSRPSSSTPTSSKTSSSTNSKTSSSSSISYDNTNDNPQTGEIAIFGMWVIAFGAICYSFWYFKKLNEN